MEKEITENNFNRLSISIMSKYNCSYSEAMAKLYSFKINLICGEEITYSIPLQAALVTAVNCGCRAFLGGTYIVLPVKTKMLLPWPGNKTLNEVIVELGGVCIEKADEKSFSIMFGLRSNIDYNSLEVVCNDWQAGILNGDEPIELAPGTNIPTAGIAAGALAVGTAFLRVSGIHVSAGDKSFGISLWRPDLNWLDPEAIGKEVTYLPAKYWLLGLGHLGQSYLWNIACLPYADASQVKIMLQDIDLVTEANISAGLLCDIIQAGRYKTRVCSAWLEDRKFVTRITERKFDETTKCKDEEPLIALCGFDSATSRLHLENAGFDLIVESALGGDLTSFDNIMLHTFPNAYKNPKQIWVSEKQELNKIVLEKFAHLEMNGCGIIGQTLASKAVSSAFVGAFAGSLVVAELLRGLNGGKKFDTIVAQVRNLKDREVILNSKEIYSFEMSRNGFVRTQEFPTTVNSDVVNLQ